MIWHWQKGPSLEMRPHPQTSGQNEIEVRSLFVIPQEQYIDSSIYSITIEKK